MSRKNLITLIASMSAVCLLIICVLAAQGKETKEPALEKEPAPTRPETEVSLDYPDSSRSDYADVTAANNSGSDYTFRIFDQKAGYATYSDYLRAHGCSTCALTSILRNVPGLEELTPDACIEDVLKEVAGEETFNSNFSRAPKKQMPITLYGMTKVFDKYGVYYELPDVDPAKREQQITDWLKAGDPVMFTFGDASEAHLSGGTHTILLLGLDEEGRVIIGDSLHKKALYWGAQGLVKTDGPTVADMLAYVKRDDGWSVLDANTGDSHFFYDNSSDRGYLLVRIDDPIEETDNGAEKDSAVNEVNSDKTE
ncbi:MAG: hypothetical protein J5961_07080 [Mogibacterium sp.]|nr:hypothetical protein [Mogibacterium sp.]